MAVKNGNFRRLFLPFLSLNKIQQHTHNIVGCTQRYYVLGHKQVCRGLGVVVVVATLRPGNVAALDRKYPIKTQCKCEISFYCLPNLGRDLCSFKVIYFGRCVDGDRIQGEGRRLLPLSNLISD